MSGDDLYVESLAAEIYWAGEQWFRKINPYHALGPKWFALRDDLKAPYREFAKQLVTAEQHANVS